MRFHDLLSYPEGGSVVDNIATRLPLYQSANEMRGVRPPPPIIIEPPMYEPPKRLSALIRLAVEDSKLLDRRWFVPSFNVYYLAASRDRRCYVCLSGILIATRLRGYEHFSAHQLWPNMWREPWPSALHALDAVRSGAYHGAFSSLGRPPSYSDVVSMRLPLPDAQQFINWEMFDRHAASLLPIADRLDSLGF